MFLTSTLQASVFMVKNYLDNLHSIKNTGNNLTMKQEDSSWKHLSLVGDEEIISLSHAKVHVFSDSVQGLER